MTANEIHLNQENIGKSVVSSGAKHKDLYAGKDYRFYHQSALKMQQCADKTVALTVTSPPYWNAIDYDIHSSEGADAWHRNREYSSFGDTFDQYLKNLQKVFRSVLRVTVEGGFCAIVVGTILHKGKHYPIPMSLTQQMLDMGWEFHQDIIWNKVTGGVKRAGCFIQKPNPGYYYPNIMTEYILIFRKSGAPRRGLKKALDVDDLFKRDIANNIWHIAPVPPRTINHPCPYPQEIVRRLVLLYSQEGDEVLDPFLGSGQTALVALKHARKCVGYDIESQYIELSEQRIAQPPKDRRYNLLPKFDKIAVSA